MLQKNKLSRNQTGFSLIELMVAVAILALAAFGIFQAYTVGFMTMAESRERTEAVNYVRQALENIKNMDFDKVEKIPRTPILGTDKYEREIFVFPDNELNPIRKEVKVVVYWVDRDGNPMQVETSMLLTKMNFLPADAAKIVLYVYPYNILYPINDSTELTAAVKDVKGNTVNYWEGDIEFEITVNYQYGYLEETGIVKKIVATENGIAKCTFFSDAEQLMKNNEIAFVTIKAYASDYEDLGYDEVEIMLTPGPVRVLLKAREVGSEVELSSPVTVKTDEELYIIGYILKANNEIFTDYPITINFNTDGKGTISPLTKETDKNGKAEILYTAGGTPGTDVITGSATDLFSGAMKIFIAGEVAAIDIEAYPISIFDYESSTITCTLKDENGITVTNPYSEEIIINLNIFAGSIGNGSFNPDQIIITPGQSSGASVFTPIPGSSGEVIVKASNSTYNFDPDTVIITINKPLIPDYIEVSAQPSYIKVGSEETSIITATVRSEDNKRVANYDHEITFITNKGVFVENNLKTITVSSTADYYLDGQAWLTLEGSSETVSGVATIMVSSYTGEKTITGQTTVDFYVEADHIDLSTSSYDINILGKENDSCTVTATIKDSANNNVTEYLGKVTFTIIEGGDCAKFANGVTSITKDVSNGIATTTLYGKCSIGTVVIQALSYFGSSRINSNENLSINVSKGVDLTLLFNENSVSTGSPPRDVDFIIKIDGGKLKLYNFKVNYDSSARLTSILINNETVYTGNVGTGDLMKLSSPYILNGDNDYTITYNFNSNINNLSFETLLNPECDTEYSDLVIKFNT
ncbi:MAG: hypothetical protein XD85_0170 [Parcubacteria bacterium 34_609]|nr:MAG: hypothetical protein XD85_0170 [Parcubacteria bacterium 34_609]KUK98961.1 MAG: hypothetical protein XE08_0309 [Parcubacteria bacterium 32_520]